MTTDKEQVQELHRQLMVMRADYDDLLKRLAEWAKDFFKFYNNSDEILNGKE